MCRCLLKSTILAVLNQLCNMYQADFLVLGQKCIGPEIIRPQLLELCCCCSTYEEMSPEKSAFGPSAAVCIQSGQTDEIELLCDACILKINITLNLGLIV